MVTAVTVTGKEDMNTAEIKSIVDDERAEQLTAQLCHHWDVATQRLDTLAQEVTNGTHVEVRVSKFYVFHVLFLLQFVI